MTIKHQDPPSRGALVALMSEGFLSRLSSGIVGFALPLYALQLGLSFAEISILVSVNIVVGMALKPFIGPAIDRIGIKISTVLALSTRSVLYLLLGMAGAPLHLYLLQTTRGVTKAVRDPTLYALLAAHGNTKRVARTFGWYQAAKGSAGSLGHAVAGFLLALTLSDFFWVFAAAALIAFIPSVLFWFLIATKAPTESAPPQVRRKRKSQSIGKLSELFDLSPFLGFGFLVSASSRMLRRMMPLLLVEYAGLAASQAGGLYLLAAVIPIIAAPGFGWIYDRISPAFVLQARSALNATSSLLYILSPTLAGFAIGKLLDKTGSSAFGSAWGALMTRAAHDVPGLQASRFAVMSAADDAGKISGPIFAGVLWSAFGPVAMLAARLGLSLSAALYTMFLLRWLKQRYGESPLPPTDAPQVGNEQY